jgi:hypothetical protein
MNVAYLITSIYTKIGVNIKGPNRISAVMSMVAHMLLFFIHRCCVVDDPKRNMMAQEEGVSVSEPFCCVLSFPSRACSGIKNNTKPRYCTAPHNRHKPHQLHATPSSNHVQAELSFLNDDNPMVCDFRCPPPRARRRSATASIRYWGRPHHDDATKSATSASATG